MLAVHPLYGKARILFRFEEEEPTAEEESWFLTIKNVMLKSHDDIFITIKYADEQNYYTVLPNKIDYSRPLMMRIVLTPSLQKQFRFSQLYARMGVINGTDARGKAVSAGDDDERDDVQVNGRFDLLRGRTYQRVSLDSKPSWLNVRLSLTAAGNLPKDSRKKNKFQFRVELYNGLCPLEGNGGRASSATSPDSDASRSFNVDSPPATPPRQSTTNLALQSNISPSRRVCLQEHGRPIIVKESSSFFLLSGFDYDTFDLQDVPWNF